MAEKPLSTTEIADDISNDLNLPRSTVKDVLVSLTGLAANEINQGRPFVLQGLVKIEPKMRPARKARMGRNPQTGEEVKIAAKPASIAVKARPLAKAKAAAPDIKSKAGRALKK